ncbi:MAG TPA: hypothetical protein DIT25_01080 [Candidatus Moranbacteria bacterium]|nr:hypothetical protein [Candidatus Moranbacteria bacterium]
MRKIQEADVKNKKVLVRVDFNVGLAEGKVKESFKIASAKETVDYLLNRGAKVALMSHLGRPAAVKTLAGDPTGKIDPEFSLRQIVSDAEIILSEKITFISDCTGVAVKEALDSLNDGVLLLENVRFYPGDEANDENFARQLAENFDLFVNDAFSASHRDHASVTGVAKLLPSYAGLRLQEEIHEMNIVKDHPVHPAVAIIGGAKIETKLPVIQFFEEKYDHILVGGKIANEAADQKMQFSQKVVLPVDLAKDRFDMFAQTIEKYKQVISGAKTIVWNGPMGKFEEKPYDTGTNEVLSAVIKSGAYVLMGGGESVEILEEQNVMVRISYVSTGGGAMLEYLSGNPMPGIEVLK